MKEKNQRDKNKEIIRKELTVEIDQGLEVIKNRIGHLYKGLFGRVMNPIVKQLFVWFGLERARETGLKRVDFVLDRITKYKGDMDSWVEKNFEEYLNYNEEYLRANKKHPKIEDLKCSIKKELRSRVELLMKLLDGEGDTYAELLKSAFPKRSDVETVARNQLDALAELMEFAEKEEGLVKIPRVIKKEVFVVARAGFNYAEKRVNERMDKTYGCAK